MTQTQVIYMPSQRKDLPSHWRKQQHTRRGLRYVVEPLSMKLNWFASFLSGAFGGGGSSASAASASCSPSPFPSPPPSPSPAACKKIQQWFRPERISRLFPSSQIAGFFCLVKETITEDSIFNMQIRRLPALRSMRFWNYIWIGIYTFRNLNYFKTWHKRHTWHERDNIAWLALVKWTQELQDFARVPLPCIFISLIDNKFHLKLWHCGFWHCVDKNKHSQATPFLSAFKSSQYFFHSVMPAAFTPPDFCFSPMDILSRKILHPADYTLFLYNI